MEREIISIKDFKQLPKGRTENKIIDFFKNNKDKAFKQIYISKVLGLKKSTIYISLNNLLKTELIEKRGDYYAFKEQKEIGDNSKWQQRQLL